MSVPGGYPGAGPHASGPHPIGPQPISSNPSGPQPIGPHALGPHSSGGWGPANSKQDTGPIPRVMAGGPVSSSGSAAAAVDASASAGASAGARSGRGLDPARLLGLAVAVLGAMNFLWGFLPELTATRTNESLSVFAVGPAYVPILLLIAGLLALAAFLPGSERSRLAVAAVSVGGATGAIVSLGTAGAVQMVATTQVGKGLGAILLVVFGIVQAVVAIGAYVIGADFSHAGKSAPGSAGLYPASVPRTGAMQPGSVQPGWFGPATGGPPLGYPGYEQRYAQPVGPAPDESATGPQVVVGTAGTSDPRVTSPVDSSGPVGSTDPDDSGGPTEGDRPAADLAKS